MFIGVHPWLFGRVRWLLPLLALAIGVRAAETIPPAPQNHFNDYAGVVAPAAAQQLNAELTQFERETSNQILVAVYPKMQSDSSIEDYTVRVAQAWRAGQAQRDNGAVLFVFTQDRALYIQVGYGLEGALPDALCKRIIEDEITPQFRAGDYTAGLAAGARAMIAAAKGEYAGTGRTVRESGENRRRSPGAGRWMILFVLVMLVFSFRAARRGTIYGRRGRRSIWLGRPGGFGGGWGGGGGGRWGGGGGTFSGGGGSFGGGGAGGRW
ncbi:TPM domain-containing protein [Opitutus terrae]|uniref:TPM domain-containing protein n=1 Tax=Opitutus terrae (strain DSM 11246 / JCM 15787 / PB90-1) TaxID=452637 RepID=B1ZWH9_OPITP|nr:TPM domain-containing protein [Opitutus terrae]ACB73303.1 protein of unknown function DUF477 [Opitutus terrae PB90-1]